MTDLNKVTDWMGNVVAVGDTVVLIRIRTGSVFKNGSILLPDSKRGLLTEIKIPDKPDEDCWVAGKPIKILNGLMYRANVGKYFITLSISTLNFIIYRRFILAIKGVSDKEELYDRLRRNVHNP